MYMCLVLIKLHVKYVKNDKEQIRDNVTNSAVLKYQFAVKEASYSTRRRAVISCFNLI
jgi:hypothetical protein